MPWKERVEEERLKFIALLDDASGWSMSEVCAALESSQERLQMAAAVSGRGLDGLREQRRAASPSERTRRGGAAVACGRKQHRVWGPRNLVAV